MGPSRSVVDNRFVVHLDPGKESKSWDSRSYVDLLLIAIAFGLALCWAAPHFIDDEEQLNILRDVEGLGIIIAAILMSIPWRQGGGSGKGSSGPNTKAKPPVLSAVVDVSPLGVQISTTTTEKKGGRGRGSTNTSVVIGTPRFLPMEDIYDVIVNEIVMGRSVESKVMFRVRLDNRRPAKDGRNGASDNDADAATDDEEPSTIFQLLRDGSIELVDAFPPVKLSHLQCLQLCEGISEAIDSFAQ